jgi:hypothetical protein
VFGVSVRIQKASGTHYLLNFYMWKKAGWFSQISFFLFAQNLASARNALLPASSCHQTCFTAAGRELIDTEGAKPWARQRSC